MTTEQLRLRILTTFQEVADQNKLTLATPVTDQSALLQTGLDSIAFATVITLLELSLGYDPFLLMEEAYYPTTFGEFLQVYDRFKAHSVI